MRRHGPSIAEVPASTRDNSRAAPDARRLQLDLGFDDPYRIDRRWAEILECCNDAVRNVGLKEVAYALDQQASVVAHALAERERHYVRAKWLVYLTPLAPSDRIVEVLAESRGLEVRQAHELSPTEKLQRLTSELEKSPLIAEAIYRGAFGPGGRP